MKRIVHTDVRRTALAALIALAATVLLVASPGKAAAAPIDYPIDQASYAVAPNHFSGIASTNLARFVPNVHVELKHVTQEYRPCPSGNPCLLGEMGPRDDFLNPAGIGEDAINLISGQWIVNVGHLTHRYNADDIYNQIPDGTPLTEGKYRLRVTQYDHTVGAFDENNPNHSVWESTFFVDSKAPDTILNSVSPSSLYAPGPKTIKYHAKDQKPGSPTGFECRIDGGPWFGQTMDPGNQPESEWRCYLDPLNSNLFDGNGDLMGRYSEYTVNETGEGFHTFEVRARDAASNVDPTPLKVEWLVDTTPPVITIDEPQMRKRYVLGQHVPSDFGCVDPLAGSPAGASGIDTCEGPATVDTSKLGNFTFTVKAKDKAGNESEKTYSYAVDPPRYPDVVGSGGPIAYYRLSDPLGASVMTDSSGNHRNGEYKNGIALERPAAPNCERRPHQPHTCDLTEDPENFSAFFPARDGYGFTNNIAAPQTAYTLEAWINRADANTGSIIGQGGAGQLFVNSEGKLALRQTQDTVTSEGPVLTPGQWWHVAATWNGHATRLYVNGQLVGSSSTANKPPSGSATLYVGYGDQAPWFHGRIDEAAYYGSALPAGAIGTRYVVGTAHDVPGPVDGPPIQRPDVHIVTPPDGALYAPTKTPALDFHCSDLDGNATVAACTAKVDGVPAANGSTLPDSPGVHTVEVTAIDSTELTRTHTHTYTVKSFRDIYNADHPIAYYRLGDAAGAATMTDSSGNHRDGTYKNAQDSGPVGISGDGDRARSFFGTSGYGYTQNITAPTTQGSMEAWVNPDDTRDQSVMGHGDAGEIFTEGGVFKFRHMGTTVAAHLGPDPGRFTQVVAVWDGVTISLYVDGELHGSAEATKRPSSSSTFYVGYGEIKPWFKGSLDEVAYYGSALTPGRVLEHFLADPPPGGTDSGEDPDTPTTDEPDDPTTDPGDEPVTGDPTVDPIDDPATDPGDGSAESGGGKVFKNPKAGKRAKAKARAKCHKMTKAKKRKACLRRVNRR